MNLASIKENPSFIGHLILQGYAYVNRDFGGSDENRIIVAVDSKPSWRHEWYNENRPNVPRYTEKDCKYKGSRETDSSLPWKEIFDCFNKIHDALDKHSDFDVVRVDRAEGDDIIAVAARHFAAKGEKVFIVASDKDFNQLVDNKYIYKFDPIKRIFVDVPDKEAFLKYHTVIGDKSDEIWPIKDGRFGEKTALKLIESGLEVQLATNPEMRERYHFNRHLIDFDYIPEDVSSAILKVIDKHEKNYSLVGMSGVCQEFHLRKMFDRIGEFRLQPMHRNTKLNSHPIEKNKMSEYNENALEDFFSA